MTKSVLSYITFIVLFLTACTGGKLMNYDFPTVIDTNDREIQMQEKGNWTIDGLSISNEFDGARMNGFSQDDDGGYRIKITPENEPINDSPWFGFTVQSDTDRKIKLTLDYGKFKHRYWPKLSTDLKTWTPIDSADVDIQGGQAIFMVDVSSEKLYFCGQELNNTTIVKEWFDKVCQDNNLKQFRAGTSKLGRPIWGAESIPANENAETIVFISRQHPPEVTGYQALQSYFDEIMNSSDLSTAFRQKYRILIYPLLNPDGVDLGHWRHGAGGIDLNRDWAYYRQPEINQVANHIFDYVKSKKSRLILGIDFHSTQEDVFYTYPDQHEHLMDFRKYWVESIENILGEGEAYEDPDPLGSPVSKGWFIVHFGAEAVTYEVGDETPRDFIDKKARVSSREMMKLLIMR